MRNKFKFLYEQLILKGKSRMSALVDTALVAIGDKGVNLSDDACSIITSPEYDMCDNPDDSELNTTTISFEHTKNFWYFSCHIKVNGISHYWTEMKSSFFN